MKKPKVKTIRIDEDIWGMIMHIGMSKGDTLNHPYDMIKPLGKNATVGLEKILKYYLLNHVAKKWGIDIDPTLDVKQIMRKMNYMHIKKVIESI